MLITEWKRGHAEAIYRALKAWSPAQVSETGPRPNALTSEQQVVLQDRRREALDHWALVIARHKVAAGERWAGGGERELRAMVQASQEKRADDSIRFGRAYGADPELASKVMREAPGGAFNPPRLRCANCQSELVWRNSALVCPKCDPPTRRLAQEVRPPETLGDAALSRRKLQAHTALRLLAGMCDGATKLDGAGFSKNDVERGHHLAAIKPEMWDTVDWQTAQRLVRKYRRQLAGVDLPDDLRQPLTAPGGFGKVKGVTRG